MDNPFDDLIPQQDSADPFADLVPARPQIAPPQELTFAERAALEADKVLTSLGSALPDWLPSRQSLASLPTRATDIGERAALEADKVLTSLGSVAPDWMPSRQNLANLAAGASEAGGLLRGADRLKNVATEDDWRTAGRILDPTAAVVGTKAFQAAQQLPKLGALMPRIQPVLDAITKTPLRQNVLGGAAAGGAVGTLGGIGEGEPVEGALSGAALGAGMGAAFTPLAWLGEKSFALAANLWAGAEGQVVRYLDDVFKGDKAMVASALQQLKGLVPGERPTTGLGAVSGPTPITGLKALEEQARARNPQLFAGVDQANQAARATPLEAIAAPGQRFFDPDTGRVALSELEALRKRVTDPLYAMADKDRVAISQQLDDILSAAQAAPLTAKGEASYQQMLVNLGRAAPEGATAAPSRRMEPNLMGVDPGTPFLPVSPMRSIQELQRVKDEFSKRINDLASATDAPTVNLRNQLTDARRQLTEAMKTQSGAYAMANDIFRNYSAPQNQADVAQALLNALRSPSGEERSGAFLAALRDAPGTIKKAGAPRFQDLREVMTPDQMREVVSPIEASVRREAAYNALNAPTSSLPAMRSTMQELEEGFPALLKTGVSILRRGLATGGKATTEEANAILDRAAQDPKFMVELLNRALPKERSQFANAIARRIRETRGAVTGETVEQQ